MSGSLKKPFNSALFYVLLLLVAAGIFGIRHLSRTRAAGGLITHTVGRRDMTVSVIEGGNLIALRSQRIINEVPGQRAVLEAIEDGTHITEADIESGLVLLRMDSKDLEDRLERLKLDIENSRASYLEAEQRLEMQKKQNESDISQSELRVRFGRMDLEKFLGEELAREVIEIGRPDIPALLASEKLGGETLSRSRQLANNIDIAKEQLKRAEDKAGWSERLAERGYITQSELEADMLAVRQREVDLERAELDRRLFAEYDFPKDMETRFWDYEESIREHERVRANCEARLIQAESSLQSRKRTYELNMESYAEVEEHIRKCTIKAEHVGFVSPPTPRHRMRAEEPIQPGTVVRLNQELFNLPDFRSMGVQVNIHEAAVRKVSPGQAAVVRIDAFPDMRFTGTVRRIAHMPDAYLQFLNPDINVYGTTIALENTHDYLRPGMAAETEIIIKELKDVIAIPIDAVLFRGGAPHCVVVEGAGLSERRIEIGESSETLVEITSGLDEGETIALQPRMAASQIRKIELEETGRFQDIGPEPVPNGRDIPSTPDDGVTGAPSGREGGQRQQRQP